MTRDPRHFYHRGLPVPPPPSRIDPEDGPIARIGTPEWSAWHDYYTRKRRLFSLKMMENYAAHGVDWPVAMTWPPA